MDTFLAFLKVVHASNTIALALILAFAVMVIALCVLVFLQWGSGKSRYVIGIVVGIIGLYNMTYPIIALLDGDALSQYVVANLFVGTALLFLALGSALKNAAYACGLVFLVLTGPGIFLMIGSWAGSGFSPSLLHMIGLLWALAWVSLLGMLVYGYLKKPKTA